MKMNLPIANSQKLTTNSLTNNPQRYLNFLIGNRQGRRYAETTRTTQEPETD